MVIASLQPVIRRMANSRLTSPINFGACCPWGMLMPSGETVKRRKSLIVCCMDENARTTTQTKVERFGTLEKTTLWMGTRVRGQMWKLKMTGKASQCLGK
jgi:hypothetical protein